MDAYARVGAERAGCTDDAAVLELAGFAVHTFSATAPISRSARPPISRWCARSGRRCTTTAMSEGPSCAWAPATTYILSPRAARWCWAAWSSRTIAACGVTPMPMCYCMHCRRPARRRGAGRHRPAFPPAIHNMKGIEPAAAGARGRSAAGRGLGSGQRGQHAGRGAPRIGDAAAAMRAHIASALNMDAARVGVKATTNEGLGFVGRGRHRGHRRGPDPSRR